MPKYKNCSGSSYMYDGVMFHPYEVHEVPGYISHPKFITTDEPETVRKSDNTESSAVTETVNQPEQIEQTEQTDVNVINITDSAENQSIQPADIEPAKRGKRSTKGE